MLNYNRDLVIKDYVRFAFLIVQTVLKIVSEYDQEIQQSQTADKPMTPQESTQLMIYQYLPSMHIFYVKCFFFVFSSCKNFQQKENMR